MDNMTDIFPPPTPEGEDLKITTLIQRRQIHTLCKRIQDLIAQNRSDCLFYFSIGYDTGAAYEKEKHQLQQSKTRIKTPASKANRKRRAVHKTNVQKKPTDRAG